MSFKINFFISEDPVHTLKHTPAHINPVLKMLVDLFSRPETASIFYTSDQNVLIDILVRQLSDLSAGEPVSSNDDHILSNIKYVSNLLDSQMVSGTVPENRSKHQLCRASA